MNGELFEVLLIVVAVAVIIAMGWGFFNGLAEDVLAPAKQITERTVNLASIAVSSQLEGRFALGFGGINGKEYYVCYQHNEDESLQLIKLDASLTRIYQTLKADDIAYAIIGENGWGTVKSVQLYVPENTVQVEYDLSLSPNGQAFNERVERFDDDIQTTASGERCTSCGANIHDAPFCGQCGMPSGNEMEASVPICPNCGAECDTPFCGDCGTAMNKED